jgi:two-component sensor histidine kinase
LSGVEETSEIPQDPASDEPPGGGGGPADAAVTMVAEGPRLELRLEGSPEAARLARAQVDQLRDRLEPDVLEDLMLLVTELVTNSVRHGSPGPAGVGVVLGVTESSVRLEVTDAGRGFSPGSEEDLSDPSSGWGLYLVDRLATSWGTEAAGEGTRVWLELARK